MEAFVSDFGKDARASRDPDAAGPGELAFQSMVIKLSGPITAPKLACHVKDSLLLGISTAVGQARQFREFSRMAFKDMREFIAFLEEDGQLKRPDVPIKAGRGNNELQALMRHLCNNNGPALVLDKLEGNKGAELPVLFNIFGTRERTAMTIGLRDYREAKIKHASILADKSSWIEPRLIDAGDAPCKEVRIEGNDIELDKQIPHVWFGKEGPSYVTNAITISKDPETDVRNVGWYRYTQFLDAPHPLGDSYPDEFIKRYLSAFYWWNPPMSHIGVHAAKAARMGKPLEVAFAAICEPAIHLAAGTGANYGDDEYAYAGGLRGKALDVVKCETVDLEVPATAEWIFEGEVIYEEHAIGPHSNPVGYYDLTQVFPVVKVNCITHRRNPLWYATMEMVPPFDHNYIAIMPLEGELLSDLRNKIPEVSDVVVTPNMHYIVQLNVDAESKPHPEFGKYVIHAVWGAAGRWARTAKVVTVVGPDVDPYDLNSVEWAIMTRVQPYSDTLINKSGQAMVLDPSAIKGPQGGAAQSEQIGYDATIKIPERFSEYAEVSNATPQEVAAIAEKLKGVLD